VLLVLLFAFLSLGILGRAEEEGGVPDLTLAWTDFKRWTCAEYPVAENTLMEKAIREKLNYTSGKYFVITNGEHSIKIYIAYWSPGIMQPRAISHHSPDTCWLSSGWSCVERVRNYRFEEAGFSLIPGEYGVYEVNKHSERVVFWHLVDGVHYSYDAIGIPGIGTLVDDFKEAILGGVGSQWFIRVSWDMQTLSKEDAQVLDRVFGGIDKIISPLSLREAVRTEKESGL